MEVFKLNKVIENEKLDLEMAIAKLKEAKEHLSQSLRRRKELANQMNDQNYIEEKIEDLFPSNNSDEANNVVKELLEKNGSLQEEVRKLKREQELHSTRFCEILEQRNKLKDELDGRNIEVQNKTLQLENLIDQISHTNEEILNLRSEIESTREELRSEKQINLILMDDLNTKKQINEGMLKSQEDLDQLYE